MNNVIKIYYTEIHNPNGNLLFTADQLNTAPSKIKCLPVRCMHCGKIFYINRIAYNEFLHGYHTLQFCCKSHAAQHNNRLRSKDTHIKQAVKLIQKSDPSYTAERYIQDKQNKELKSAIRRLIGVLKGRRNQLEHPEPKIPKQKRKRKVRTCRVCGHKPCPHPHICKSGFFRKKNGVLARFGFDMTAIGSDRIFDELQKVHDKLYQLYVEEGKSTVDITKQFNLKSKRSIELLMQMVKIKPRTSAEGARLANLQGKCQHQQFQWQSGMFRTGIHVSWEGLQFYYRSSYELDYMKHLDRQQIRYRVEYGRFPYFDSVKNQLRTAIPDFYLPDLNALVEIKSLFTYNRQNMVDRSEQFKYLGYNFILVLEHQYYLECPEIQTSYSIEDLVPPQRRKQ